MSKTSHTVVDSMRVLVLNGTYTVQGTIKKDGTTYSVSGKTITATIRNRDFPSQVINSAYEDISVTSGYSSVTASNGGFTFSFSPASANGFTAPADAEDYHTYFIQLYVSNDDYYPQLIQFGVRKELN